MGDMGRYDESGGTRMAKQAVYSMTGYGKGENQAGGRRYAVELKSVNNKFCEFNIRMPRFFNPLEERLRKLFAAHIFRGRVDININFTTETTSDTKISYNAALAKSYHQALTQISSDLGLQPNDSKVLELVARLPDVIELEKKFEDNAMEGLWVELSEACTQAMSSFLDMRAREGDALVDDIRSRAAKMQDLLAVISKAAPQVVESYRERLKKRMTEALAGLAVDEARFLNEVAHFADKAAIDEEITRLDSHIKQLYQILDDGGTIGRKLDFLAQEMAREANTIGSKANSTDISKTVIELKGEVEKIREQVQNIE